MKRLGDASMDVWSHFGLEFDRVAPNDSGVVGPKHAGENTLAAWRELPYLCPAEFAWIAYPWACCDNLRHGDEKMADQAVKSVYLSGWEYNRLLDEDEHPATPRNSALPAQLLWNGSHQLWMFETVYCTQESFDCEVAATGELGWVNGDVLEDLKSEGILQPVPWGNLQCASNGALEAAKELALEAVPASEVRTALVTGDAPRLELAKAILLGPIRAELGCLDSGAPNSINNWFGRQAKRKRDVQMHLARLAEPLIPGLHLCRSPQAAVSAEEFHRQKEVERTVEKPMIPDLLAGEGDFHGPRGYESYHRQLVPYADAYRPVNDQLRQDWRSHQGDLLRLRDLAKKHHLWKDLHHDWLPRLLSDDDETAGVAARDFERWVKGARWLAPISQIATAKPTKFVVGNVGPYAVGAALTMAGLGTAAAFATAVSKAGADAWNTHVNRVGELAVFYQTARPRRRWWPW